MLAWAIDLDGVVWRGSETVPGSPDAIARLRRAGAAVVFVTNSAVRTPDEVADELARHGIPDAAADVITSAAAAASLVEPGQRVIVVGSDGLRAAVTGRGAEVVATGPADVVVVGLTDTFAYDDVARAMTAIRAGARFVATNDDATFPDAGRLLPGNGALVAAVATAGGRPPDIVAGKPHETIARFVRRRIGDDGIMVGDRPETDGLFARSLGYRFGLVLTGVVGPDDLPVDPEPDHVAPDLAALVDHVLAELDREPPQSPS
ncbi:MAG: HAD-IIA family hydrolase [Acidimicrobiales bacterium]